MGSPRLSLPYGAPRRGRRLRWGVRASPLDLRSEVRGCQYFGPDQHFGFGSGFLGVAPVADSTTGAHRQARPSAQQQTQPTSAPLVLRVTSSMSKARPVMTVAWTSAASSMTVGVSPGL